MSTGKGHTQELVDKYNMKNVFKLPISEQFSATGDSGRCVELLVLNMRAAHLRDTLAFATRPFVLSGLSADEEQTYDTLATTVRSCASIPSNRYMKLTPCQLYRAFR